MEDYFDGFNDAQKEEPLMRTSSQLSVISNLSELSVDGAASQVPLEKQFPYCDMPDDPADKVDPDEDLAGGKKAKKGLVLWPKSFPQMHVRAHRDRKKILKEARVRITHMCLGPWGVDA